MEEWPLLLGSILCSSARPLPVTSDVREIKVAKAGGTIMQSTCAARSVHLGCMIWVSMFFLMLSAPLHDTQSAEHSSHSPSWRMRVCGNRFDHCTR